jgi:hypothetical protein
MILALPALVIPLMWLLIIRPYCVKNRAGYTPGNNIGATMWVDWQQAGEIAKAKGDTRMILVCRIYLGIQLLIFGGVAIFFLQQILTSKP